MSAAEPDARYGQRPARRRAHGRGSAATRGRSACSAFLVAAAGLHAADPAELRGDRRPGPGDLGAAARAGRRRPGDRRDLWGDRPVDRLDDGVDQRRVRHADEGPVRRVRCRRRDRRAPARARARRDQRRLSSSLTRVPDIVVTLAMSFVWAGCALLVLKTPGGGAAQWLKRPRARVDRQRVDPEGGGRPDRDRGGDLDPDPTIPARPVALRRREQPARGVPERRVGRSDEDHRPTCSAGCSRPSPA